jgi:surface polysaccharide O-acyltransferase-like enzyme
LSGVPSIQNGTDSKNSGFPLPVDLIRTVAIILVITYHSVTLNWNVGTLNFPQSIVIWSSSSLYLSIVVMGVPLFVILSGALLLQPSKLDEPIRVFLKKRLARIGVAFVFWSIIYFAWSYFVDHATLTAYSVIQTLLQGGAYYQFWFIYLLMGLYLITPVLRVVVKNADRKILRYLIVLWFISATVPDLLHLITGLAMDNALFLFGGYIGYFVLGAYLIGADVKTKTLKMLLVAGVVLTFFGLFAMNFPFNALGDYYFFTQYTSMNVILASVAAFMLLSKYPRDWPGNSKPWLSSLVHAISANTLPIFFLHPIILEIFNKGLIGGFQINVLPPIEIPLLAAVTLFICLGLILLMKQVPVLRKLIG